MKLLNAALIRTCLIFIFGILTGFYISVSLSLVFIFLSFSFLIFLFAYFKSKNALFQDHFFGISCFALFFMLGIFSTAIHLPENQPQHYLNQKEDSSSLLLLSIKEHLKPDLFNEKYIAEVKQQNGHQVHGKMLLLFKNDSLSRKFSVGDKIIISKTTENIPAPLNPHQFDYQKMMKNRGIFREVQLSDKDVLLLDSKNSGLLENAEKYRSSIVSKLKKEDFEKDDLAIIQALLLGQRQDISKEIYADYAAAGVIHILAVSGLHVGIILLILNWLLSPMERVKSGRVLKTLLLLLLLWGFATLSGLSPSVLRAVTMFSFIAIGMQVKRRTSVLNSVVASLLILLLIRPQFIFEVGFQLSYLAVFGIVLLQPIFYNVYRPRNKFVRYFWSLFTVTMAAQIGVLSLSLYYFHQFPGLFFLSNLVILPFLGIILSFGILVILLALLNFLPNILVEIYDFLIGSLNSFVSFVAQQQDFLFEEIPFSGLQTFAFYLLIISLIIILRKISYKNLIFGCSALIILQLVFIFEKFEAAQPEFIIFHKSKFSIIGKKEDKTLKLFHTLNKLPREENVLKNYILGEKIDKISSEEIKNLYVFGEKILFVIDSSSIYKIEGLQPEIILLSNSPKVNLNRLLLKMHPEKIIADGSNFKSYVERWRKTCSEQKIPFHYTGEKGAFIIEKGEF